jgi:hypothetical protein
MEEGPRLICTGALAFPKEGERQRASLTAQKRSRVPDVTSLRRG